MSEQLGTQAGQAAVGNALTEATTQAATTQPAVNPLNAAIKKQFWGVAALEVAQATVNSVIQIFTP